MRKRIIQTAITITLTLLLNACGTKTHVTSKKVQSDNVVTTNQSIAVATEQGVEVKCSINKQKKEVYNCCGFITDTGVTVKLGGAKGIGAIGLTKLLDNAKQDKTVNGYDFQLSDTSKELGDKLLNGELDMVILPVKTGVKLYNATNGKVVMLATSDVNINKSGKKEKNNKKYTMVGIFTTKDYIKENKNAVDAFLGDYSYSVMWMTDETNAVDAVNLIEKYNIEEVGKAKKIVSSGRIVCLRGEEMKEVVNSYLSVISESDKKEMDELPKNDFYYIKATE